MNPDVPITSSCVFAYKQSDNSFGIRQHEGCKPQQLKTELRKELDYTLKSYLGFLKDKQPTCLERISGVEITLTALAITLIIIGIFVIVSQKHDISTSLILLGFIAPILIALLLTVICCKVSAAAQKKRLDILKAQLKAFEMKSNSITNPKQLQSSFDIDSALLSIKIWGDCAATGTETNHPTSPGTQGKNPSGLKSSIFSPEPTGKIQVLETERSPMITASIGLVPIVSKNQGDHSRKNSNQVNSPANVNLPEHFRDDRVLSLEMINHKLNLTPSPFSQQNA